MRFKRAGFLTKLIVLALLAYMAMSILDLRAKIQETEQQRDLLAGQVADCQAENDRLDDAIAHKDDPEVLERVAQEKGYVDKNAILYIDVAN